MNLTKNGNQIILELTDSESLTVDWLISQNRLNLLTQQINTFLSQRGQQRDFDELHELHKELLGLDEVDKAPIRDMIASAKIHAVQKRNKK